MGRLYGGANEIAGIKAHFFSMVSGWRVPGVSGWWWDGSWGGWVGGGVVGYFGRVVMGWVMGWVGVGGVGLGWGGFP